MKVKEGVIKMIRYFCIPLIVFFWLLSPLTVMADVVTGNEFFYKNEDKMLIMDNNYRNRRFIINSKSGYVIPKEEPGTEKSIASGRGYASGWGYEDYIDKSEEFIFVFINGETCYIEATYLVDGQYWGVMSPSHIYQPSGWILMDDLLVEYDQGCFEEENEDKFYTYTGNYDAVLSAKQLVQWEWPGSDKEKRIVYKDIDEYADVLYAYKDNYGREWGKTKYSEEWICLSDPENEEILSFNGSKEPSKWSINGNTESSLSNKATVYPPANLETLREGNKPKSAFESKSNKFLKKHENETEENDRIGLCTNGPEGYVALRAEPGWDNQILTHWELGEIKYINGTEIPISNIYCLDGEYWGFMDYEYNRPHPPGWVPMDYIVAKYTNDDFVNEHKSEFYTYGGKISEEVTTETFVLWESPLSDIETTSWGKRILDERPSIVQNAYKDKMGREWVYIDTYWNQEVAGWLCVDDPENKNISIDNQSCKPVKWNKKGIYNWKKSNTVIYPPENIDEPQPTENGIGKVVLVIMTLIVALILVLGCKSKKAKEMMKKFLNDKQILKK